MYHVLCVSMEKWGSRFHAPNAAETTQHDIYRRDMMMSPSHEDRERTKKQHRSFVFNC